MRLILTNFCFLLYLLLPVACMQHHSTGAEFFPDISASVGKAGKQKNKMLVPPDLHKNLHIIFSSAACMKSQIWLSLLSCKKRCFLS
jgi:hypothetical protein